MATLSLESHTVYDFYAYLDGLSIPTLPPNHDLPNFPIDPPPSQEPADVEIPHTTARSVSPDPIFSIFVPRRSLLIIRSRCYTDLLHSIAGRASDHLRDDLTKCLNWDPDSSLHLTVSQSEDASLERSRRISLTCRRVEKIIKGLSRFGR